METEDNTPTEQTQSQTPPKTYVVQAGETLFRIALKLGIPLNDLLAANNITEAQNLVVGQTLMLPEDKDEDNKDSTQKTLNSVSPAAGEEDGTDPYNG